MKKVTVIGAGFAGLTLALRLAEKGFQVEIHEKSSRVGGLLGTDRTEYGIAERAANALIRTQRAENLFAELGLTPSLPLKSSKKRFIFRDHPRAWPLTAGETLKLIAKAFPFQKKKMRPRPGQTLKEWGHQHLGEKPTRFLLEPAMQGIYANEISGLSASLILGPLFSGHREKYKGLLTGPGGMQDLIDHLEKKVRDLGVQIHLNSNPKLADVQGPCVLATSAQAASQLTESTHPELQQILKSIPMSSVISTTLFFKKAQESYRGFGCLIPRGFNFKALGILMNSSIFKDRDRTYNETWILGGLNEDSLLELSDSELLKLLAEERFRILGHKEPLLDYRINRWPKALPYYGLALENARQELENLSLAPQLYLHGNYLSGMGLSKILERSDLLAEQIGKDHG